MDGRRREEVSGDVGIVEGCGNFQYLLKTLKISYSDPSFLSSCEFSKTNVLFYFNIYWKYFQYFLNLKFSGGASSIYDSSKKFFDDPSEKPSTSQALSKSKPSKMTLKDYERKVILEKQGYLFFVHLNFSQLFEIVCRVGKMGKGKETRFTHFPLVAKWENIQFIVFFLHLYFLFLEKLNLMKKVERRRRKSSRSPPTTRSSRKSWIR